MLDGAEVCDDSNTEDGDGCSAACNSDEVCGNGVIDTPVGEQLQAQQGVRKYNEWLEDGGPHVMMLVPDLAMLEGMSTDPHNGGPYVMWRGTDFAHVMIPTPPRKM